MLAGAKRSTQLAVAALLAVATIGTPPVAAGAEPSATLSGTVRGTAGEDLTSGAHVIVYRDGTAIASSVSSAGRYLVSGLTPGEYDVLVSYCCSSMPYIGEWGDGSHGANQEQATVITDGANSLDFELDPGAFIEGSLTGSGVPINGELTLTAVEPVLPGPALRVSVSLGTINSTPLPPGKYSIVASGGPEWVAEDHNGVQTTSPTDPPLAVELGDVTSLDIDLAPAGEISGTVYVDNRDGTQSPVPGASVVLRNIDTGTFARSTHAGPDGRYTARGLSGRYIISFSGGSALSTWTLPEYLGGSRTPENARVLTVRDNEVISGADATLDMGGKVAIRFYIEPEAGKDPVSVSGSPYLHTRFERLDEGSGEFVVTPHPGFEVPVDSGPNSGALEPGTYKVTAAINYWGEDPWAPGAHNRYTGETGTIIVRAGEVAQAGNLILETDIYDPLPIYRFWSPTFQSHFYTADPVERDRILAQWQRDWTYEGIAYSAFRAEAEGTVPLYRFWSNRYKGHFYTADEAERDRVIATWSDTWDYEGIAYFVFPAGTSQPGTAPVFRFWSPTVRHHFYTSSASERDHVVTRWPDVWTYEEEKFRVPSNG